MQIHPDIAALRSDPALQRQAHAPMAAAYEGWQNGTLCKSVAAELANYAAGQTLAECEQLMRLVTDIEAAQGFVAEWQTGLLGALRDQPLGSIPSRHSISVGLTTVQLMTSGNARLSLLAYEERADIAEPTSVMFTDGQAHEIVLAGKAHGIRYKCDPVTADRATIAAAPILYEQAYSISLNSASETRQFITVDGSILLLQLTRTPDRPQPSKAYALADGKLIHQASGNKRASQHFLALDVLGAMERADAVPVMTELALSRDEEVDLRWEAVRQTLSLDAGHGLSLLQRLADIPDDPLFVPSTALFQSLIQANAQIACLAKETAPCPA